VDSDLKGLVKAVSRAPSHNFSKANQAFIRLIEGHGVEGDAHHGVTDQHRSHVKRDPTMPNLRQVHLIHAELLDELAAQGFKVSPGQMGENVMTQGLNLLSLPRGTRLHIGADAVIELTGLRNPCHQLDGIKKGLMAATLDKDTQGNLIRKAGVMSIVLTGGEIRPGDAITVELPPEPHHALEKV
jgi:MOSC domain-containing protein YiiM